MRSVKSFFRGIPAGLLRDFISNHAAELTDGVDWNGSDAAVSKSLSDACSASPRVLQQQIQSDVERITALANEPGEAAMRAVGEKGPLEALPGNAARALWLFVHDPVHFRRAEDIRYTDERRRGRMWDGFEGPPDRPLGVDPDALDRLKTLLREQFGWEKVHIEVFERSRIGSEDETFHLLQTTIYREGWPDQVREFVGENLEERSRRPVYEAAITYEPKSGSLEVVANEKKVREDLASLFCTELLSAPFGQEKLKPRRYDLDVLRTAQGFPVDAEDRIDSVRVSMLRLMPMNTAEERLVLETLSGAKETVWELAERLGPGDPLRGPWVITQARLSIKFQSEPGQGRGPTLPITITMPHGCDLKDRTPRERRVGEEYLARWGLLENVGAP